VKIYLVSRTGKDDRLAELFEYDVRARQLRRGPSLPFRAGPIGWFPLRVNHDGSIVVLQAVNERGQPLHRLIDAKSGRTISEIGVVNFFKIRPLSDGSVAVAREGRLSIVSVEGTELASIAIPVERFSIGREIAPGKLVVGARKGDRRTAYGGWVSFVVDTKRGVIERQEPIYTRFDLGWRSLVDGSAPVLYYDTSGALGRWNVTTGEKRIVLRPAQASKARA
jgi:hypothetical protein